MHKVLRHIGELGKIARVAAWKVGRDLRERRAAMFDM
jgi:hypothetical protein